MPLGALRIKSDLRAWRQSQVGTVERRPDEVGRAVRAVGEAHDESSGPDPPDAMRIGVRHGADVSAPPGDPSLVQQFRPQEPPLRVQRQAS